MLKPTVLIILVVALIAVKTKALNSTFNVKIKIFSLKLGQPAGLRYKPQRLYVVYQNKHTKTGYIFRFKLKFCMAIFLKI